MMQIRTDSRIHLKWGESGKKCDWFTRQSVVSRPLLFSPSGLFAQIFLPPNPPNSLLPSFHFPHQVSGSRLCRLGKTEHYQLFEETGRFMAKPNNRWPQHVYPTLDNQNSFSFKTFSKEPHIATPHSHCSETKFNSNVPQLTGFLQIIISYIYLSYFIAFLKYFTEGRVKNAHFSIFTGPTGIKGATDQMLPWKAPNDPKTLPIGILHGYMSILLFHFFHFCRFGTSWLWPILGHFGASWRKELQTERTHVPRHPRKKVYLHILARKVSACSEKFWSMQSVVTPSLEALQSWFHDSMGSLRSLLTKNSQPCHLFFQEGFQVGDQDVYLPGGLQLDLESLVAVVNESVHRLIESINVFSEGDS